MKLSLKALCINVVLAFLASLFIAPALGASVPLVATTIVATSTIAQYIAPELFKGIAMEGLQTEVWIAGIKENPIPNNSFVYQSVDLSQYVEHNKLHLAEAGVEPTVHEDYFATANNPLPVANIEDIANEVVLHTYSTEQTRHNELQEIELSYDKRSSVIQRHRTSLAKNIGKRAAWAWAPQKNNEWNKVLNLTANDSILDAIIDLKSFLEGKDIYNGINICLNSDHFARIRKEDKKLYKDILNEEQMYGIKVFQYNQTPIYTKTGEKKPFGAVKEADDKQSSFVWVTDEVFRCFGDVKMYPTLRDSGLQGDTISFAQRALVGVIRAKTPKFLGAIL
nr:MAG TPA: Major capsid protein [Caudoviricetes sp.]